MADITPNQATPMKNYIQNKPITVGLPNGVTMISAK